MRLQIFSLIVFPLFLFSQEYNYINGMQFPQNGDSPSKAHVAFLFPNPQDDELPIWGKDHGGTTWIWEYNPFQQTGYYVTFWWADNGPYWSRAYYGCHPFPIPPSAGRGTSHYWELAGMDNGNDNTKTRTGEPLVVEKNRWYKQALRVQVNNDGSKTGIFYINLPDTSDQYVIVHKSDAGWGETNPPNPAVTFGSAPWADKERMNGVLGRVKIFNKMLSGDNILKESEDMSTLVTSQAQANIWWGVNSFDDVDDLICDYGTGRAFEWAEPENKGKVITIDSVLISSIIDDKLPGKFELKQNYPNPFNPSTTIEYQLPHKADVSIAIYNSLGNKINSWNFISQSVGVHSIVWNGNNSNGEKVGSGIYVYNISSGEFTESKKLVLIK